MLVPWSASTRTSLSISVTCGSACKGRNEQANLRALYPKGTSGRFREQLESSHVTASGSQAAATNRIVPTVWQTPRIDSSGVFGCRDQRETWRSKGIVARYSYIWE